MRERYADHAGRWRSAVLAVGCAVAVGLCAGPVTAQDATPGPPDDPTLATATGAIYPGTCAALGAAPAHELGTLRRVSLLDESGPTGGESVLPSDGRPLLAEDIDDDGMLDPGEDQNGNGALDEGFDVDGDGVIDAPAPAAAELGSVAGYVLRGGAVVGTARLQLLEQPHAVVVTGEGDGGTVRVACGEVVGSPEDVLPGTEHDPTVGGHGDLVVALRPVAASGFYGFAVLSEGTEFVQTPDRVVTAATVYLFDRTSVFPEPGGTPAVMPGSAGVATPAASPDALAGVTARRHPANIYAGSCGALGDVVYPLSPVGIVDSDPGADRPGGEIVGQTSAVPALQGISEIPAAFDAVLSTQHALAVLESDAPGAPVVACGDLGGTHFGETLMLGLVETNGSGYTGIALLSPEGDHTTALVYLARTAAGGGLTVPSPG